MACNAGTELTCISNIEDHVKIQNMPVLPYILHRCVCSSPFVLSVLFCFVLFFIFVLLLFVFVFKFLNFSSSQRQFDTS